MVVAFAEFLKARRAARGFAHHHEHQLQERRSVAASCAAGRRRSVGVRLAPGDEKPSRAAAACLPPGAGSARFAPHATGGTEQRRTCRGRGTAHATIDRVAVRYYAPETGGSVARGSSRAHALPSRRASTRSRSGPPTGRTRTASCARRSERHVAEDMLAALAVQSGNSCSRDLPALADEERTGLLERVAGAKHAPRRDGAEGIDDSELDALLRRRRAA